METVFYTFCAYLPFLDILRFGKRWMALTVAGNMAIHMPGVAWVISMGRPDLVMVVGLIMVPISLELYFLNIQLSPGKLLFTYMLLVAYQNIAMGVAAFLSARLFHASARSLECGLICLVLFILAWRPMYRLFRYAAEQVYRIDAPKLWRLIWLLPAIMSGIVTILTGGLQAELVQSWNFLFARTSLLLCVVVIYWVLVHSLEGIREQAVLQEQLYFEPHLLELQMDEQQKHSRLMLEHEAQLRRQRHDLRHQLAAIQQMADTHPEQLKEFIFSLLDAIPAAPRTYCENPAVNAAVSHYAALCQGQGVDVQIRLDLPQRLEGVTDGELCVIFGNLLENALEACGRMEQGRKFLRLDSQVHYDVLTITMDNSFDGPVRRENGVFRSSKRSELGVGVIISHSHVDHFGGIKGIVSEEEWHSETSPSSPRRALRRTPSVKMYTRAPPWAAGPPTSTAPCWTRTSRALCASASARASPPAPSPTFPPPTPSGRPARPGS